MKRVITVVLATLALLLVGGVAYASIPGPNGVISGCRKNTDGSLRVIDSTATCPSGYTALNWNQTGPAGLSGVHVVTSAASSSSGFQDVSCPSGETALSVSFDQPGAGQVLSVTYVARPIITGGKPTGYSVAQSSTISYTASVVCALAN